MREEIKHSSRFLLKRQKAMATPLLIAPFLCLLFWINGGGTKLEEKNTPQNKGINTEIPTPVNREIEEDKSTAYIKAEQEEKEREKKKLLEDYVFKYPEDLRQKDTKPASAENTPHEDPYITKELNALYQDPSEMNNAPAHDKTEPTNRSDKNTDQSLYTKYLQKTLGLDTPEELPEKEKRQTYEVVRRKKKNISRLTAENDTSETDEENAFHTVGSHKKETNTSNIISTAIHQDQTIRNGDIVKMRILTDININGRIIPKNNFIYRVASISKNRLNVEVTDIKYKNNLFPVELKVYDEDGMEGVRIAGSKSMKTGKNTVAQIIDGANPGLSVNVANSIGQQLAMDEVKTALSGVKVLASSSLREEKVQIKANHRVYLK